MQKESHPLLPQSLHRIEIVAATAFATNTPCLSKRQLDSFLRVIDTQAAKLFEAISNTFSDSPLLDMILSNWAWKTPDFFSKADIPNSDNAIIREIESLCEKRIEVYYLRKFLSVFLMTLPSWEGWHHSWGNLHLSKPINCHIQQKDHVATMHTNELNM